jgi:hypothetical protein
VTKRRNLALVTIYTASNETLREIYAGSTNRLLHMLEKSHGAKRPARMKRWKSEHSIVYRALVYSMPRKEIATYLRRWRKRIADQHGWTLI